MAKKVKASFTKSPSDFISCNTRCSGDLYLPQSSEAPPVVIMAHGLGAERTFRLPAYAEHFASRGLSVYLFDYRCFGGSDGQPRNYIDQGKHLKDWQAAINHVRSLPAINPKKIALWGSSFGGGHVIVTAAKISGISAIVAQVPFVDAASSIMKLGPKYLMQATPHAIREILRIITFRSPHFVKIIGHPGEFAIMNTPDSYSGYSAMMPENSNWENKCPARIILKLGTYRPMAFAKRVKCPALLMVAEKDSLIDANAVEKTAARIPNSELVKYPIHHFDIYTGKNFQEAVKKQAEFLLSNLT